MQVSDVTYAVSGISVSGKLVDGAYVGPESVLLFDQTGRWVPSTITHHEILLPKDWPIRPDDGSTLILHILKPSPDFELDRSQLVLGQGNLTRNENRVDISSSLGDSGFWVVQMWLYVGSEGLPEPPLAWGFTKDAANMEYNRRFKALWDSRTWPFVQLPLTDSCYVELEYAAGVEYQTRVWIGEHGGRRVLLGYDSGHFSFPTFRIQEVLALADRMGGHPSAPLLLLPGAYLMTGEAFPTETVRRWVEQTPGLKMEFAQVIVDTLSKNVVGRLQWDFDETCGWINNWKYSQRNPKSPMTILSTEDFQFIRKVVG